MRCAWVVERRPPHNHGPKCMVGRAAVLSIAEFGPVARGWRQRMEAHPCERGSSALNLVPERLCVCLKGQRGAELHFSCIFFRPCNDVLSHR